MITFTLPIDPPGGTAQQKRAVVLPGHGVRFFKAPATKRAEAILVPLMLQHAPPSPMQGPLAVSIAWRWPYRSAEPKRNRALGDIPHDKRPDLDNMAKTVLDCMVTAGFFGDDAQISAMTLTKHWSAQGSLAVAVAAHERNTEDQRP